MILDFVAFKFLDIFGFTLAVFQSIFGLIIVVSSFGHKCVRRNFLFMMTGVGKGFFNIFVGSLLFFTNERGKILSTNTIMGSAMIFAGLIFIFLSKHKKLSDEDINRAISVQKKSVINSVGQFGQNNK